MLASLLSLLEDMAYSRKIEAILMGVPGLLAALIREDSQLQMRALDSGCLLHLAAVLEGKPGQQQLDVRISNNDQLKACIQYRIIFSEPCEPEKWATCWAALDLRWSESSAGFRVAQSAEHAGKIMIEIPILPRFCS